MSEVFEKIFEHILNADRIDAGIILAIFFFILFSIMYVEELRNLFIILMNKIIDVIFRDGSSIDIKASPLFLKEKIHMARINDIDFEDKDRNFVFRLILTTKTKTVIEMCKSYTSKIKEIKKMTKEQLIIDLQSLIYNIIDTYEKRIMEELIKAYGRRRGREIYYCVYDNKSGKTGFKQYHEQNISVIFGLLDSMSVTPIKNNLYILMTTFDIMNYAIARAITDLYKTFITFNGDLTKIFEDDKAV